MCCVVSTVLLLYTGGNLITSLVCIKDTDDTISISGDGRKYGLLLVNVLCGHITVLLLFETTSLLH